MKCSWNIEDKMPIKWVLCFCRGLHPCSQSSTHIFTFIRRIVLNIQLYFVGLQHHLLNHIACNLFIHSPPPWTHPSTLSPPPLSYQPPTCFPDPIPTIFPLSNLLRPQITGVPACWHRIQSYETCLLPGCKEWTWCLLYLLLLVARVVSQLRQNCSLSLHLIFVISVLVNLLLEECFLQISLDNTIVDPLGLCFACMADNVNKQKNYCPLFSSVIGTCLDPPWRKCKKHMLARYFGHSFQIGISLKKKMILCHLFKSGQDD